MQDSDTQQDKDLTIGSLTLSIQLRVAMHENKSIALSPNAFSLLLLLMQRSPAVVSVSDILEQVWKDKVVNKETVRQQILALREQLGSAGSYIQTVRGHGYQVLPPAADNDRHVTGPPAFANAQNNHLLHKFRDKLSSLNSGTKAIALLCMLTVALLLLNAINHLPPQQGRIELPVRVIVLPFEHIGLQNSALPRKIQDELITALSHNKYARVTAVSVTDNTTKDGFTHTDYAQRMDIDLIFEGAIYAITETTGNSGSADCVANDCRINMRAIWTHDGATVWRETFVTSDHDLPTTLNQLIARAQTFLDKKTRFYLQQQ